MGTGLEQLAPGTTAPPAQRPLTCLQGVECGLAHGLIDAAGGDGDTVGHSGGLVTGEAFQGHRWVRSDERRVRQALPLPSPLSRRPGCEGTMPPRARPLPTGPHWRSRGRGAPGEMDSQSRDRQLGTFGGHWCLCRGRGLGVAGRTLDVLGKMQDHTGALGQARRTVACGPGGDAPSSGTQVGQGVGWQGGPGCPSSRPRAPPLHRAHAHSEATGSSGPTGCHWVLG